MLTTAYIRSTGYHCKNLIFGENCRPMHLCVCVWLFQTLAAYRAILTTWTFVIIEICQKQAQIGYRSGTLVSERQSVCKAVYGLITTTLTTMIMIINKTADWTLTRAMHIFNIRGRGRISNWPIGIYYKNRRSPFWVRRCYGNSSRSFEKNRMTCRNTNDWIFMWIGKVERIYLKVIK